MSDAGLDAGTVDSATPDTGCNQPEEPAPLPLPPRGSLADRVQLRVTEGYIYMRRADPAFGEEILRFRPGSIAEEGIQIGRRLEIIDVRGDSLLTAQDGFPVEVTWHRGASSVSFELPPSAVFFDQVFQSPSRWQSHASLMSETRVAWQSRQGRVWSIEVPQLQPTQHSIQGTGPAPVVNDRFMSYQSFAPNATRIHVVDNAPVSTERQFDTPQGGITVALSDDALYFAGRNVVFMWRAPFNGTPTQIETPTNETCDEIQSGGQSIYLVCDIDANRRTIRRVVGNRTERVLESQSRIRGADFGERFASFIEVPFDLVIGRDSGQGSVVVVDLQTGRRTVVAPFDIAPNGLMDQPRLPGHTEVHDDIIVWYSTQSQAPAAGAVRMEKRCD